jgi:hypothetical protein
MNENLKIMLKVVALAIVGIGIWLIPSTENIIETAQETEILPVKIDGFNDVPTVKNPFNSSFVNDDAVEEISTDKQQVTISTDEPINPWGRNTQEYNRDITIKKVTRHRLAVAALREDLTEFYTLLAMADIDTITGTLLFLIDGFKFSANGEAFQALVANADIYREKNGANGVNALLANVVLYGNVEQFNYIMALLPEEMLYAHNGSRSIISYSWRNSSAMLEAVLPYATIDDLVAEDASGIIYTALENTMDNESLAHALIDAYPELVEYAKQDKAVYLFKYAHKFSKDIWKKFNFKAEDINSQYIGYEETSLLHSIAEFASYNERQDEFYYWLIEQGGNPDIPDNDGMTAAEIFEKSLIYRNQFVSWEDMS